MNVFLRELSAYRKSTIIWCASLSAILIVFMALYPAFTSDVAATKQVLGQFPEALRTALNISLSDFFTIYGFYGYLLNFAILAGAIQAMNLGTGIISKEVAGKTADFLLSKPMTRGRVVSAKLAAAFTIIVITNVVFCGVSYLAALMVATETFAIGTLLLLASTMFLVQLVFLALGALFAVLIPKIKSVIAVSMPAVFTLYIVGTLGDVLGNDKVRYMSPFKFYDTAYIIKNVGLEGKFIALEAAIIIVAIAASYVIYIKKDVRASA
ncbi:MAG: ABC transporter permease [Actinobacteria bacterium HGW-Actinobacteria-1]|nr:MAG: ABC transporter permease [Actinobacteria bacterium HGW-Actinobacteria-1]